MADPNPESYCPCYRRFACFVVVVINWSLIVTAVLLQLEIGFGFDFTFLTV